MLCPEELLAIILRKWWTMPPLPRGLWSALDHVPAYSTHASAGDQGLRRLAGLSVERILQ